MAIVNRLHRLFRADVNAVLDQIEEPQLLLRQSLRDMEDALEHKSQQLKAHELESQRIATRSDELQRRLQALGEEIDLGFAAGSESLQRTLVRRRLELQRLIAALEQRRTALANDIEAARRELAEQQQRFEDLQQRAAVFDLAASTAGSCGDDGVGAVSEADVELALIRERKQRGVA